MTTAVAPTSRPTAAAAAPPRAALADVCEPLFLHVCRLNRQARLGGATPAGHAVRSDLSAVLADVERAAKRAGWAAEFERVRRPLLLFADAAAGALVPGWQPMADGGPGGAGGDLHRAVSAALEATDPAAVDRLVVLYTALALAGDARYAADPQQLESMLNRCAARIWGRMDADETSKLCPDAYGSTRRFPLPKPTASRPAAVAVGVVTILAVAGVVGGTLYALSVGGLRRDLTAVPHSTAR